MRFLRTVRLDESDTRVYDPPALPGEWAVPGSFVFVFAELERLEGKAREALRRGFLGTQSFGWSTLVSVEELGDAEHDAAIERLAAHLQQRYGAPDPEAARRAAREEMEFAAGLCEPHPPHTLLAVERELRDNGIVENFRVVRPPSGLDHGRVRLWTLEEDD